MIGLIDERCILQYLIYKILPKYPKKYKQKSIYIIIQNMNILFE